MLLLTGSLISFKGEFVIFAAKLKMICELGEARTEEKSSINPPPGEEKSSSPGSPICCRNREASRRDASRR